MEGQGGGEAPPPAPKNYYLNKKSN
jgi:hypothetical protein